jgi:hypothetical protein
MSRRPPPSSFASDARGFTVRFEPPDATVGRNSEDTGGSGSIGSGQSISSGLGSGLGSGPGGAAAMTLPPLPIPEPAGPPASQARPPQLIYPVREREADDASLFVARLAIDRDGFVIGARLVRGPGGSRDEHAASAVWRFRYRPALDDDGRPIAATIEQSFLVE